MNKNPEFYCPFLQKNITEPQCIENSHNNTSEKCSDCTGPGKILAKKLYDELSEYFSDKAKITFCVENEAPHVNVGISRHMSLKVVFMGFEVFSSLEIYCEGTTGTTEYIDNKYVADYVGRLIMGEDILLIKSVTPYITAKDELRDNQRKILNGVHKIADNKGIYSKKEYLTSRVLPEVAPLQSVDCEFICPYLNTPIKESDCINNRSILQSPQCTDCTASQYASTTKLYEALIDKLGSTVKISFDDTDKIPSVTVTLHDNLSLTASLNGFFNKCNIVCDCGQYGKDTITEDNDGKTLYGKDVFDYVMSICEGKTLIVAIKFGEQGLYMCKREDYTKMRLLYRLISKCVIDNTGVYTKKEYLGK